MSKIFEGAKFGDAFKTKDGRKVIYHYYECWHYLITDDGGDICCGDDGGDTENDCDNIVGRWVEPIDEKRLNDMAVQLADDYCKAKKIKRPLHIETNITSKHNLRRDTFPTCPLHIETNITSKPQTNFCGLLAYV